LTIALGRQGDRQTELMVTGRAMPRSPGHVFCDRRQHVLIEAGHDAFTEATCKPHCAATMGAPSIPPGPPFGSTWSAISKGSTTRGMRRAGSGAARTRDNTQASHTAQTLEIDEPGTTGC
jgi:hypothetical protein